MQDQTTIDRPRKSVPHQDPEYAEPTHAEIEPQPENMRNAGEDNIAMFAPEETEDFRGRWYRIQTEFIDDPRKSVQRGDELVAETMKRLMEMFAREREKLEAEWDRGEDISTEDLRLALQRYRSFFDRLLSV